MWRPSFLGRGHFHWFIDHAANNKDEGVRASMQVYTGLIANFDSRVLLKDGN